MKSEPLTITGYKFISGILITIMKLLLIQPSNWIEIDLMNPNNNQEVFAYSTHLLDTN